MNVLRKRSEPDLSSRAGVPHADSHPNTMGNDLVLLVHRQMRMLAGPHPDLEDLSQTALEQILSAQFEGRSKWSTFTHSICYRVWMKHLRWRYRFVARFRLTDDGILPEPNENWSTVCPLVQRERYERLYTALEQIPSKRRAVVSLHDIGGMDVEDIATIVEVKVGTVRSRLRDGRKKLSELLHQDPYFGDDACEGELP